MIENWTYYKCLKCVFLTKSGGDNLIKVVLSRKLFERRLRRTNVCDKIHELFVSSLNLSLFPESVISLSLSVMYSVVVVFYGLSLFPYFFYPISGDISLPYFWFYSSFVLSLLRPLS